MYLIKPFKDNELGTGYRQGFIKSFSDITDPIHFFISGNNASSALYAQIPASIQFYFENVFYASFPTSELVLLESIPVVPVQHYIAYGEKDVIATDKDFTKDGAYLDPMKDIFAVYENVDQSNTITLQFTYTFKKAVDPRKKYVDAIRKVFTFLFAKKADPAAEGKKEEKEDESIKFGLRIGFGTSIDDVTKQQGVKMAMKSLFNKFVQKGGAIVAPQPKSIALTIPQLVNFFHLPTSDYFIKPLDYSFYRKLPYPANLPTPETTEKNTLTLLGKTDYRGQQVRFGIKDEDSFRHMYIVGKTGTGKSTFLSNIIKSHMYTNKGLCLIDPHGDLVETVMEHIPSWRTNDVILFDVADSQNPIGFNLLQYNSEDEKNIIVSGVVGTFKKLFGTSRGPRLEYVLRNVILSVVEYPNATMMHIMRVLTDKNFREEVLEYVKDPIVMKFWRTEFDKWMDNQRNEAIAPITNKVGQFLSSSIVRNIFGQPMSKLNMRKVMDEGKILLINLSKGKIGEDNTEMIGSFIVTKLQIDAMSRANIPEKDRRPFYLHIDEFQNFATDAFATILSEARKYRLALIVANQYTSQLSEVIRDAIFGNVGSMVSFNVGYDDAVDLAQQFKGLLTANDLISIPKFRAYIRLMTDGIMSDAFSMSTLPLSQPEMSEEIKEKIRTQSRQRYSTDRNKLEELIKLWSNKTFSPVEKAMQKAMAAAESEGGPVSTASTPAQSAAPAPKPASQQSSTPISQQRGEEGLIEKSEVINQKDISRDQTIADMPASAELHETSGFDSTVQVNDVGIPMNTKTTFSIADVKVGDRYDGFVKLKYNYGLFVTVKGVEGLLHKNFVKAPEGIKWKDIYNIGDKIRVKAVEFKDINGEKRVVRSQV